MWNAERTGIRTAALLMLLASLLTGCRRTPPDLVVITLDTCRADRLGAYGGPTAQTPVFDEVASGGVLFEECMSPAPITLPAHCSLFTGQTPRDHGVRDNGGFKLPDQAVTLAEILRDRGYTTAAFVSGYPLRAQFGLNQGFQVFEDSMDESEDLALFPFSERNAEDTTTTALSWLKGCGKAPLFLWVHYYDPHAPYSPPEPYLSRFKDALYEGEISYADAQMGRLLKAISQRGRRTVLLIVGDHGESLGAHGEDSHGLLVYQETLRIPCVLQGPGLPRGLRIETPVAMMELMPAMLGILGRSPQGSRIISLCGKQSVPDIPIFFESTYGTLQFGWDPLAGVRLGPWKFTLGPELFNLSQDPQETTNLVDKDPQRTQDMKGLVDQAGILGGAWHNSAIGEETSNALLGLGYLSSSRPRPELLSSRSKNPRALVHISSAMNAGLELARSGQIPPAIAEMEKLLPQDPDNPRLNFLLGRLFAETQQWSQAEDRAKEAVALDDAFGPAWVLLGRVLREQGKIEEAAQAFEKAVSYPEDSQGTLNNLALCYEALGQVPQALATFERSLSSGTPKPEILMNYGFCLLRARRPEEAVRLLAPVAHSSPSGPVLSAYGAALASCNRLDEAVSVLERALALRDQDVDAWINLAMAHAQNNRQDLAEATFKTAWARCPGRPELAQAWQELFPQLPPLAPVPAPILPPPQSDPQP